MTPHGRQDVIRTVNVAIPLLTLVSTVKGQVNPSKDRCPRDLNISVSLINNFNILNFRKDFPVRIEH